MVGVSVLAWLELSGSGWCSQESVSIVLFPFPSDRGTFRDSQFMGLCCRVSMFSLRSERDRKPCEQPRTQQGPGEHFRIGPYRSQFQRLLAQDFASAFTAPAASLALLVSDLSCNLSDTTVFFTSEFYASWLLLTEILCVLHHFWVTWCALLNVSPPGPPEEGLWLAEHVSVYCRAFRLARALLASDFRNDWFYIRGWVLAQGSLLSYFNRSSS